MRKQKEDKDVPSGLTSNSVAEGGVSKGEGSAERELKLQCPREMKVKLQAVNGMRTWRGSAQTLTMGKATIKLSCLGQVPWRFSNLVFF